MKYNYFNFKRFEDSFLLTNDAGKYIFMSPFEMSRLLNNQITENENCYKALRDRFFIFDEPIETFATQMSNDIRGNKSYLFSGPSLHIFVLTNECNMNCIYCQAQDKSRNKKGKMTREIAQKAVELALSSPNKYLTFEFQGGEPLLNFDILRYIVLYTEQRKSERHIRYTIASNLTLLSDNMLTFLKEHEISVSTSLDGDSVLHNYNRKKSDGGKSFEIVYKNICRIRDAGIDISAIQTTTQYSLPRWKEMVDAYIQLGFNNIFIRPLTPLGMAHSEWERIGYSAKDFITFYANAFEYILQKNIEGYHLSEGHASIFLRKILQGYSYNYMELRSPCGASVGQIAYYYDGEIYTCDEGRMLAEMGDKSFCLGSVNSYYGEMMDSPVCKAVCSASTLESAPTCSSCVYQPYCGTCPVINYALYGDVISKYPNSFRCQIFGGILNILFSKLKQNESSTIDVLNGWL